MDQNNTLVSARMLSEYLYCKRITYYMYCNEFRPDNEVVIEGRLQHEINFDKTVII